MKYSKYNLLFFTLLLFSSCGTRYSGHTPNIPSVSLTPNKIYNTNPSELQNAKAYSNYLVQKDIKPIYLYLEDKRVVMADETGNGTGVLPNNFRFSAMYAIGEFAPKVKAITGLSGFKRLWKDKETRDLLFEVEGRISAYDQNRHEINSGVYFGLDFGKGKGDTNVRDRFRNVDKISSLTIKIMLKQNAEMYTQSKGTIDIKEKNRGYSFGLSINNSGFGVNAFQNKKEGIGESIDRLLLHILHVLIKDVVERKGLLETRVARPQPTPPIAVVTSQPTPQSTPPIEVVTSQPISQPSPQPTLLDNIGKQVSQDEDDFLNQISKKRR